MKSAQMFMTGFAVGLALCAFMMMSDPKEPGPKMIIGFAVIVLIVSQALPLAIKTTSANQPSTQS